MSQENVEVVLRIHQAVGLGDLDALLAEVHPDGEYRAAVQQAMEGQAGVFRGHDGLRRWLADLHELYEDLESKILEVHDFGDRVVIAFVVRGRGRGSGITLEQPLAQVVTLRDRKAIEVHDYRSDREALEAVRLAEQPSRSPAAAGSACGTMRQWPRTAKRPAPRTPPP